MLPLAGLQAAGSIRAQDARCPLWGVFLSQGPVEDVLGHYSWALFRGRSNVRFPVKLVFRRRRL